MLPQPLVTKREVVRVEFFCIVRYGDTQCKVYKDMFFSYLKQ